MWRNVNNLRASVAGAVRSKVQAFVDWPVHEHERVVLVLVLRTRAMYGSGGGYVRACVCASAPPRAGADAQM